ncbi:MAG: chemotaxis protein CheD [Paenibacillus sp. RIFOXYA1_FULL_44_5]|nr:MAG: chemotaxis protein CheD [Paenibacillus sp. RIFOXYA1_FULL_44_5]
MIENLVKIGIADLNVVAGSGVLRTSGLGSCVGVSLYDSNSQIAGMAHIMLPSSEIARGGALNLAKYADTAIPELVEQMSKLGASNKRLTAKMAGGAQMFAYCANSDTMRIGARNVEATKNQLNKLSIPILAEDTGGNFGRTIEFYCESGVLLVRSVQQGDKEL